MRKKVLKWHIMNLSKKALEKTERKYTLAKGVFQKPKLSILKFEPWDMQRGV